MKIQAGKIQIQRWLIIFGLLFWAQLAYTAIPDNINYQGYLTDSSAVALDGSFSIEFTVYNVSAGGIALWADTQLVTVSKGLFSVQLGGGTFPVNLFDSPLWLGINVGADGEMSPRSALTSAGFAFKADDANTVGGISAATLDQSAHAVDTANPHNVTATQIGAITQLDADANFVLQQSQISSLGLRVSSLESLTGTASCASGDIISCYSGPAATLNVGNCVSGNKFCNGSTFGACSAEVLPATEVCDGQDNNCDGFADETFNLNTDILNCGSCNNDCNANGWPNVSSYLCQTANCAIETCSAGFFNTDGIANNGCESTCATSGSDLPDVTFFDNNCDGIDGDIALSFFVSPSGSDANVGTMGQPFLTIQVAINAANASATRKYVLVAAGVYSESPVLADGVSLFGQYNPADWMRSAANTTTIQSSSTVGLSVSNYNITGYIEGFSIQAAAGSAPGESSRALVLDNIIGNLYVRYNVLIASNGSNGSNGVTGGTGASGGNGNAGVLGCSGCNGNGFGGAGGASSCTINGGNGGRGGYDNGTGQTGSSANTNGGTGGLSDACFAGGNPGSNGLDSSVPGSVGLNGAVPLNQNRGSILGVNWLALAGNSGSNGSSGNSAGGGGGGGGGENAGGFCSADRGGGGGGGGGAGCGGAGGLGGAGAGGSIAVLAINAGSAIVTNNTLTTGSGGQGGNGGSGGNGGTGGTGGTGGSGADDAGAGGAGGNGSAGGSGGVGAGGAGGMSVGILRANSVGLVNTSNTFLLGTSGAGGAGATTGMQGVAAQNDYTF